MLYRPITAWNFINLAQSGFYNGLHFHRVIPDFMNQVHVIVIMSQLWLLTIHICIFVDNFVYSLVVLFLEILTGKLCIKINYFFRCNMPRKHIYM